MIKDNERTAAYRDSILSLKSKFRDSTVCFLNFGEDSLIVALKVLDVGCGTYYLKIIVESVSMLMLVILLLLVLLFWFRDGHSFIILW